MAPKLAKELRISNVGVFDPKLGGFKAQETSRKRSRNNEMPKDVETCIEKLCSNVT